MVDTSIDKLIKAALKECAEVGIDVEFITSGYPTGYDDDVPKIAINLKYPKIDVLKDLIMKLNHFDQKRSEINKFIEYYKSLKK